MALSETLTETSLCNIALGKLGATRIPDGETVDDSTTLEAIQCRLHYEPTRNALERFHSWRFASARAKLVSGWATATAYTTDQYVSNDDAWYKCLAAHTSGDLDDEPGTGAVAGTYWTTLTAVDYTPVAEEWDYMWDLPSDFISFRSIYENRFTDENYRSYALEGQKILTNETDMSIRYIKKVTDVTKFDSLFIEVLVLQLALKLVAPLGGGAPRLQERLQKELSLVMPAVIAMDKQETNTIGEYDLETWNNARYS